MRSASSRSSKNHSAFNIIFIDTAKKNTNVFTSTCFIKKFVEHFKTCCNCISRVHPRPTISILSLILTTPRSTRPVATVPRPEIEKTSSIGIKKGLSTSRCRCRDIFIDSFHQFFDCFQHTSHLLQELSEQIHE